MAKWIEAREQQFALQFELENPTASRLYDAHMKLARRAKVAGDKCYRLAAAMRENRKDESNQASAVSALQATGVENIGGPEQEE